MENTKNTCPYLQDAPPSLEFDDLNRLIFAGNNKCNAPHLRAFLEEKKKNPDSTVRLGIAKVADNCRRELHKHCPIFKKR